MKKKRAKSEIIADFISLIDDCIKEYDVAFDFVNKTDKATQDILHNIEFSKSSKERNKYSNELHYVRNDRRYWKDIREEAEILNEYRKEYNKAVNVLKQCLGEMRKVESYHAQRTYKPRIFKENNNEV